MLCWLAGWLGLATNKWVQSATREAASEARVRWRWFGVTIVGVGGVIAIGRVRRGWGVRRRRRRHPWDAESVEPRSA